LYSSHAVAAGLAIMEQSVKGLGTAFAGGAAAADDATTMFFNPAGLTHLSGSQAVAGMHLLFPSAKFRNEGSTHLTGQPLSGGEGGNAGSTMLVPNFYYSHRFNDRLSAGLGIFSPFGLSTTYDSTWAGRYHAVKSELISLNLNPSLAYRVTDKLSFGAGINAQYLKTKLSNAIDFGTIFAALGAVGVAPQGNDGSVTFKADSWSWGYNLGALYEFTDDTRAGVAYRSRIDHTLNGEAHFSGVPSPNPTGRFVDAGIKADVTLPDSLSVSIWHRFSKEWAAMADITWTNWSTIDELRIRFENPTENDAVTTVHWKDTFRYSLGAVYMPGAWAFRAGVAYDESPVPDAAHRTPRIPDNNRIWLATGFGYKINDRISINTGYAHLFVEDSETRKTATGEDQFRGGLSGSYDCSVDVISAEVTWGF
jgi:long-chain fatty acid transport protein